jgi:hypothetical protein
MISLPVIGPHDSGRRVPSESKIQKITPNATVVCP